MAQGEVRRSGRWGTRGYDAAEVPRTYVLLIDNVTSNHGRTPLLSLVHAFAPTSRNLNKKPVPRARPGSAMGPIHSARR